MRRALWMAMLATGCFSVPEYTPDTPVLVSYDKTEDGTGAIVKGPDFELHFAGGSGFHFPEKLLLDGVDVMGHDPMVACDGQDELGIRLEPTPRISAHGGAMAVKSELVPVLKGPAIVQMRVDWTSRYAPACNVTRSPSGRSTFTMFPDGRIYRYDAITDTGATPLFAADCACGSTPDFSIGTYWTLTKTGFDTIYVPYRGETYPLLARGDSRTGHPVACVSGATRAVVFAWRYEGDQLDNQANIDGADELIGITRNLPFETDLGGGLLSLDLEDTSALFFESKPCETAVARAKEYREPSTAMLSINGVPTPPSQRDGIYGGESENSPPGISLSTPKVDLVGPATRPFAVWLRFPKKGVALRATIAPTARTGAWYVPQKVDDEGSWIVWFPAPLAAGESITIEAR